VNQDEIAYARRHLEAELLDGRGHPRQPERIVLGGGVMSQLHLFPLIRTEVARLLNGYLQTAWIQDRIDEYIVPPALGTRAGVLGAIALAAAAVRA